MSDRSDALRNAVANDDTETALRLLKEAGGPCATRALAAEAAEHSRAGVKWELEENLKDHTQTIRMIYHQPSDDTILPVVALTQPACTSDK